MCRTTCARRCSRPTSWGRRSCGSRPPKCTESGSWRRGGVAQHRAELLRKGVGVAAELAPGDADHAVAGVDEGAVTRAVLLEGLARSVDSVAVELDDQALLGPEGVGLVWAEGVVHLRARQPVGIDELEEPAFHSALRDRLADLSLLLEHALERGGPLASRVPRDQGIEGERACEAADLRLVERVLELLFGYDGSEVEERTCGVGDRDAVVDGDLVCRQDDLVILDALPPALVTRHGDVDPGSGRAPEAPQRRRRAMAQHCAGPTREHGCHPAPMVRDHAMTARIPPAMHHVEPPAGPPPVDRANSQAGGEQLGARHNAVLAPRERRNPRIRRSRRVFTITIGVNVRLYRHTAIVAPRASRGYRATAPTLRGLRAPGPARPARRTPRGAPARGAPSSSPGRGAARGRGRSRGAGCRGR